MRKIINVLLIILVVVAFYFVAFKPDWIVAGPPIHKDAVLLNDKYDGDCTGTETVGRCADKCPDSQYLQGYDKVTGAAVCHDNLSPESPAPAVTQAPVAQQIDPPSLPTFQGK